MTIGQSWKVFVRIASLASCLLIVGACASTTVVRPTVPTIATDHSLRLTHTLASPQYNGRAPGTPGSQLTQKTLIQEFQKAGLEPVPGRGYRQPFAGGVNIMGWIPGQGDLADEVIVVGAHYDHLGMHEKELHPGANDNASGVAVMIAAANGWAKNPIRPRRSVLVVAFDAEEKGLLGSTHFVKLPPVARRRIKAGITIDMVGRRAHNQFGNVLMVLGAEKSPALDHIADTTTPEANQSIVMAGLHLLENSPFGKMVLSDYAPFRDAHIPFVMLSSGMTTTYHQPSDTPSSIHPDLLASNTQWLHRFVHRLAIDQTPLTFQPERENLLRDLKEVSNLLVLAIAPNTTFVSPLIQRDALRNHLRRLDGIRRRLSRGGTIEASDAMALSRSVFRLMCYCGGPSAGWAPMCNRF